MSVTVEDLRSLAEIPGFMDRGQKVFLDRASKRLADEVGKRAPGGRAGSIGRTARGKALSSTTAEIVVDHPGAKAQARGAYIKPKRGRALKFRDGGYSRRPVRIPATNFDKRGLRGRRKIIKGEFAKAHDGGSF